MRIIVSVFNELSVYGITKTALWLFLSSCPFMWYTLSI